MRMTVANQRHAGEAHAPSQDRPQARSLLVHDVGKRHGRGRASQPLVE